MGRHTCLDDAEGATRLMPTVVMDVAPEQFTVSPLLLVLMVAAIALVAVVFLLRFRRKKDK